MSLSNSMTREELLEHAALDAFGMLDEYETSLFTRSMHNAPATVQNEILQLQAQIVSDSAFIPSDVPDPDPLLRQRVLDAVTDAIAIDSENLEPLATIGRNRGVAGESRFAVAAGSGLFWRAAALALCAGLIVVAYLLTEARNLQNQVAVLVLQQDADSLEKLLGPMVKDFIFDSSAQSVHFKSSNPRSGLNAVMYIDEASATAFLVTDKLTSNQQAVYTLSTKDATGNLEPIHEFSSNGRLSGTRFSISLVAARLKNVAWQISDQTGTVLLASI